MPKDKPPNENHPLMVTGAILIVIVLGSFAVCTMFQIDNNTIAPIMIPLMVISMALMAIGGVMGKNRMKKYKMQKYGLTETELYQKEASAIALGLDVEPQKSPEEKQRWKDALIRQYRMTGTMSLPEIKLTLASNEESVSFIVFIDTEVFGYIGLFKSEFNAPWGEHEIVIATNTAEKMPVFRRRVVLDGNKNILVDKDDGKYIVSIV